MRMYTSLIFYLRIARKEREKCRKCEDFSLLSRDGNGLPYMGNQINRRINI